MLFEAIVAALEALLGGLKHFDASDKRRTKIGRMLAKVVLQVDDVVARGRSVLAEVQIGIAEFEKGMQGWPRPGLNELIDEEVAAIETLEQSTERKELQRLATIYVPDAVDREVLLGYGGLKGTTSRSWQLVRQFNDRAGLERSMEQIDRLEDISGQLRSLLRDRFEAHEIV